MIWEYALGGNVFDFSYESEIGTSIGLTTLRVTTTKSPAVPKKYSALLRCCRQIYAEASLLPFKANAFRITDVENYDWFEARLPVQRDLISEMHVADMVPGSEQWEFNWVTRMWMKISSPLLSLNKLPLGVLPGLKRLVVFAEFFSDEEEVKLRSYVKSKNTKVRVTIKRIKTI
jgi:hypothetical protein